MAGAIHFLEFRTREGLTALQRVDEISTILESTIPATKASPARTVMYLLLANNNRLEVVGETRETMIHRLMSCTGQMPVIVVQADLQPEAEPAET